MAFKRRPKREFRPSAHATVYLLGLLYLGYLLVRMILDARAGGPDAPTALHLVAGGVVLGGGMVFLAVLAWRMSRMPVPEQKEDASSSEDTPEADDEDDWERESDSKE